MIAKRVPTIALLVLCWTTASAVTLPRVHPGSPWYQRIDQAAVHPNSAGPTGMIATLNGLGGFGFGRMQIDFGMNVLYAPVGTPTQNVIQIPSGNPDDAYYLPDCEPLASPVPLPAGGAIEGQPGYSCDNLNNDCHLLVVQGNEIFEVYRTNVTAQGVEAQCLARWRMDALYPATGRGEHCTSADAAGFPIAPLLFNADEVFAAMPGGDLGHAIRFILPNQRMANDLALGGVSGRLYVHPGTHAGAPSGLAGSVPYGSRLRLRANFPMANYSPAAQVILRTMQRYGIVLADGGNIALTAESDAYTTHKWTDAELQIDSREFDLTPGAQKVLITDFEVLDTGPRIGETYDCVRSQPQVDALFANGFE